MKIFFTMLIGMLAIGATLYSGLLHGKIRHKLGLGQDLTEQVRLVESLPSRFGQTEDGRAAWVMVSEIERLDDEVIDLLECAGHFQAQYQSTTRPDWTIQLLVMVGPTGPLLAHSPEVCYPASGARYLSGPVQVEIESSSGTKTEIQMLDFETGTVDQQCVRVAYAFSLGSEIKSPKDVWQSKLVSKPFLYKIQLHTVLQNEPLEGEFDDPIIDFMREFQLPTH